MNEGVKILLERMKTNPEEFIVNGYAMGSKWGQLVAEHIEHLNAEDATALKEGISKIKQENFTREVMKELLAPEDDSLGKPWYTTRTQGTGLAGATQGVTLNSALHPNTLQNVTITTDPLINKKSTVKKHQTLFGKLFNYS